MDVRRAAHAAGQLRDVAAYVELHIEQGPVLEEAGLALGVVDRVYGIERSRVSFTGQAAHAGSAPMGLRHDALAAAARLGLAARASALQRGGVATVGVLDVSSAIPTAVPGDVTLILDQRHGDADGLAAMLGDARRSAAAIASDEGRGPDMRTGAEHDAVEFDARLVAVTCERVQSTTERWRFT